MMRRDDQTNDHDDRGGRKDQDHREDVLKDPVPSRGVEVPYPIAAGIALEGSQSSAVEPGCAVCLFPQDVGMADMPG